MTVGELVEAFRGTVAWRHAAPTTKYRNDKDLIHIVKHLGADREIASIGKDDARRMLEQLDGSGLASTTVQRIHYTASGLFRLALRRELIDENPFYRCRRRLVDRLTP